MLTMSAIECMPAIIKHKLISQHEGDLLTAAINAQVVEPQDVVLFQCINVLTIGRVRE